MVHYGTLEGCPVRLRAKNARASCSNKAWNVGWRQLVRVENTKLENLGRVCRTRRF